MSSGKRRLQEKKYEEAVSTGEIGVPFDPGLSISNQEAAFALLAESRNRELFNEWFTGLLMEQKTCAFRDVIRGAKPELWREWLKVKPFNL